MRYISIGIDKFLELFVFIFRHILQNHPAITVFLAVIAGYISTPRYLVISPTQPDRPPLKEALPHRQHFQDEVR